jgi:hypothetical protein
MAISTRSFVKPLSPAGVAKVSFKVPGMGKVPKLPGLSTKMPKMPGAIKDKPFNFSSLAKAPKIPKSPKIAIIKASIKKFK